MPQALSPTPWQRILIEKIDLAPIESIAHFSLHIVNEQSLITVYLPKSADDRLLPALQQLADRYEIAQISSFASEALTDRFCQNLKHALPQINWLRLKQDAFNDHGNGANMLLSSDWEYLQKFRQTMQFLSAPEAGPFALSDIQCQYFNCEDKQINNLIKLCLL